MLYLAGYLEVARILEIFKHPVYKLVAWSEVAQHWSQEALWWGQILAFVSKREDYTMVLTKTSIRSEGGSTRNGCCH